MWSDKMKRLLFILILLPLLIGAKIQGVVPVDIHSAIPVKASGVTIDAGGPAGGTEIFFASNSVSTWNTVYHEVQEGTWATVRGAATGVGINNSHYSGAEYLYDWGDGLWTIISREFVRFDVSAIPTGATVTDVVFKYKTHASTAPIGSPKLAIMQGTQGDTLEAADFDAFTGSSFGQTATITTTNTVYEVTFNAGGISYIQGLVDGQYAYFSMREYDHDYLNASPSSGARHQASFGPNVPELHVTYTLP